SITVPPELGLQLMDHHGSLRVTIRSTMDRDYTLNVFGTRKGHKHEKLILCAHYDTAFNCPGAVDNSAGLACLLSLAEILGQLEFSCGIDLITFSGEEFAAIGDQAYLQYEPDFENMLAVINMDGVGQKLGNNTLTAIGTSKALEAEVKKIKSDYPMMVWAEPWYESDHTLFLMNGVPCLPLNSLGINDIYHQPKDQLKWVSPSKLEEVIDVVLKIMNTLQDQSLSWCRPTSD
ncbi:MAG TPA: M28 family peptidase, partial [Sporolactobacillaceae bacterium]|nr:M28 family peptidase [Sporolactobacillaceae bacterium]